MGIFFSRRPQVAGISQLTHGELTHCVFMKCVSISGSPFSSLSPADARDPNLDMALFQSVDVESLYGSWGNICVDDAMVQLSLKPGMCTLWRESKQFAEQLAQHTRLVTLQVEL